ncbi:hypothetical protein AKAW_05738 [Aspergillus luchuensis IFO 4308]|nr:hypothetical protein AKAW_05738 [Aspergillus luchuensis IFO 4308]
MQMDEESSSGGKLPLAADAVAASVAATVVTPVVTIMDSPRKPTCISRICPNQCSGLSRRICVGCRHPTAYQSADMKIIDDVDEVFGAYDEPYTLDMVVAILALQDGIIHALKYEENM